MALSLYIKIYNYKNTEHQWTIDFYTEGQMMASKIETLIYLQDLCHWAHNYMAF